MWFVELSRQSVRFITRLKDRTVYDVVERRPVDAAGDVISDSIVYFPWLAEEKDECFFRVVEFYDRGQRRVLTFLSNHWRVAPETLA